MREVEEDRCKWLSISHKLQNIMFFNVKYKLKITHWFEMQSDFEGIPQGQLEEGIEKVAWMNPEQIKRALKIPMRT
jgi:hypothetical protein